MGILGSDETEQKLVWVLFFVFIFPWENSSLSLVLLYCLCGFIVYMVLNVVSLQKFIQKLLHSKKLVGKEKQQIILDADKCVMKHICQTELVWI